MTKSWSNKNEWINSNEDSSWLRLYLAVFPNAEINPDFNQQYRQTVKVYYKNLMNELNQEEFISQEDCIRYCNNKHMTVFDKNTFARWVRFMRRNNYKLHLKNVGQVSQIDTEMKELIKKYDDENKS